MAITIELENKQRIRHPIDLDNMGQRYKTDNNYFSFTSPSLWTLEKNIFYLLKKSTQKIFEPKYKMRPDYLSFDEYGTVVLAHLLMYVNFVPSLEDFNLDTVVVPSFQAIVDICKDKFPKKDFKDLEDITW